MREKVKMLIELATDIDEADKVIEDYAKLYAVKEKFAYLKGMFDFELIGRSNDDNVTEEESDKMDYYSALGTIINAKWRG